MLAKAGHGRLFSQGWYPHQLKEPVGDKDFSQYDGEARGFYPKHGSNNLQLGTFYPWNSFVNHERYNNENPRQPGDGRTHFGIDIYAPYFPFPFEVPIHAIAPGRLLHQTFFSDLTWTLIDKDKKLYERRPQALGNRISQTVKLDPKSRKKDVVVSYGHLSRFAGSDHDPRDRPERREVAAGELIGFAGKTGNAEHHGECSTRQTPFNINAGHVHLSLRGSLKSTSLLEVLPRPIAFHPDQMLLHGHKGKPKVETIWLEKTTRIKKDDWGEKRPKLRETMPTPRIAPALIDFVGQHPPPRAPVKGAGKVLRRGRYAVPFQWLDVDSTAKLKITRKAYAQIADRLADDDGKYLAKAEARWMAHLATAAEDTLDTTRWDETAQALAVRAVARITKAKLQPDTGQPIPAQGAHPIIALMHLLEAQYILMGGVAIEALNSDKYSNQQTAKPADWVRQPICGIGVHGKLYALAYEHAVAALHDTHIKKVRVWSVTFGAGSMRHATLGHNILNLIPNGDTDTRKAVAGMIRTCQRIRRLTGYVTAARIALTWGDQFHVTVVGKEIIRIKEQQTAVADALRTLGAEKRKKLLGMIGISNTALFDGALEVAGKPETDFKRPAAATLLGLHAKPFTSGGEHADGPHHT